MAHEKQQGNFYQCPDGFLTKIVQVRRSLPEDQRDGQEKFKKISFTVIKRSCFLFFQYCGTKPNQKNNL